MVYKFKDSVLIESQSLKFITAMLLNGNTRFTSAAESAPFEQSFSLR